MLHKTGILVAVILLLHNAASVQAIHRTVGPSYDSVFQNLTVFCNATEPGTFSSRCTQLIDCVYGNVSPSFSQTLSIGSNIAGLLPTILVLIGSPPLELVQMAMLSPHRALATCCFTIGLPVTLFRQLRPLHKQLAQSNPLAPRVREWTFNLSNLSRKDWKRHLFFKVVADSVILALTGIMIWQNYGVNSYVMIPWRCDYTWLVLAWPIACIAWLFLAVALMFTLKEKIVIHNAEDSTITYSIWKLMTLPYTLDMRSNSKTRSKHQKPANILPQTAKDLQHRSTKNAHGTATFTRTTDTIEITPSYSTEVSQPEGKSVRTISRTDTSVSYQEYCITVQVVMPSNFGLRSWRTLETTIEVMAVGIYLYATFVLMSLLFFTA